MNRWRHWLVVGGTAGMVIAAGGVVRADDPVHLPPLDGELCEAKALAAAGGRGGLGGDGGGGWKATIWGTAIPRTTGSSARPASTRATAGSGRVC